jgi:hypothetical protein
MGAEKEPLLRTVTLITRRCVFASDVRNCNNQSVAINILTGNAPASIVAHTIDVVIDGGNAILYGNASGLSGTISNGHEDMQNNLTGVTSMNASDFLLHL